nr:site-specific integrase [Rubellimicrobium sp. CFH 75288]
MSARSQTTGVGRRTRLTAAQVRSLPPGKYHDGEGTGLLLRVEPTGARLWIQRVMVRGKRRELGLGGFPTVTLAEAREVALENKRVAARGGDPLAERRRAKARPTFREAAIATHAELSPTWKNPKDRDAFLSTLQAYIYPSIGDRLLAEVTSADLRKAILAARAKAPGVARKLTYRCSHVFRWGIAEGHVETNPATAAALALPRDERARTHRKALSYAEVADCIAAVQASKASVATKLAIEFLILTASRSGEVRAARWHEIMGGTWEVPAERMKMKRPHRIPLSRRALAVLAEAEKLRDASGLIFPSANGKPLSDMTLSKLVKELGFEADVHGFRTSFRTWAQERTNFPREVAELALAHVNKDRVEAAYARSDLFEKRQKMMEAWATFLTSGLAKVVKLGGGA